MTGAPDRRNGSGRRVCPQDPGMTSCWWVKDGNPHQGDGHACVCLIPVEEWRPKTPACTGMDDVDAVVDRLVARYGITPEDVDHVVRVAKSRENAIRRVLEREELSW